MTTGPLVILMSVEGYENRHYQGLNISFLVVVPIELFI